MKDLSLYALDIAQNSVVAGAGRLELEIDEAAAHLTLIVADNGRGMSPNLLKQVTDPFTTTRTTRKTGMGLPLLRMAAELTGGSLLIESTEHTGTRVTASFCADHINCVPVGDMGSTLSLLVQGAPNLELIYTHKAPGGMFTLETTQLRALLGPGVPLNAPEVVLWVRDYVREQEHALMAGTPLQTN